MREQRVPRAGPPGLRGAQARGVRAHRVPEEAEDPGLVERRPVSYLVGGGRRGNGRRSGRRVGGRRGRAAAVADAADAADAVAAATRPHPPPRPPRPEPLEDDAGVRPEVFDYPGRRPAAITILQSLREVLFFFFLKGKKGSDFFESEFFFLLFLSLSFTLSHSLSVSPNQKRGPSFLLSLSLSLSVSLTQW